MKPTIFMAAALLLSMSGCAFLNGEPIIQDNAFFLKSTADRRHGFHDGFGLFDTPQNSELPSSCINQPAGKKDKTTIPEGETFADEMTDLADISRCTEAMKQLIDIRWANYEDELSGAINIGNASLDIVTLGVNAAGTLTGAGTTHILSAVAGGLTGSKASINSNMLYNNSVLIVLVQMKSDRASWAATIAKRLTTNGQTTYKNMYEAASDLYAYDRAGSLTEALISLQSAAGAQDAACQAELKNAKKGGTSEASTTTTKCGSMPTTKSNSGVDTTASTPGTK